MLTQELDLQTQVNVFSDGGAAEIGHGRDALGPAGWTSRSASGRDYGVMVGNRLKLSSWGDVMAKNERMKSLRCKQGNRKAILPLLLAQYSSSSHIYVQLWCPQLFM